MWTWRRMEKVSWTEHKTKKDAFICMYVYVCMYVCIYMYVHVYMYMYVYVCTYMYEYVYVGVYVCTYVCVHAFMCVYVCIINTYVGGNLLKMGVGTVLRSNLGLKMAWRIAQNADRRQQDA